MRNTAVTSQTLTFVTLKKRFHQEEFWIVFFSHTFAVNSVKIILLGQNVALCLHYKMPCLNDRDDISMPLCQEGSSGQRLQIGQFIKFYILFL